MTAPISNEPTTTRLHHYAGRYCPARPCRPRGGLQSVGVSVCCPARPRRRLSNVARNSPATVSNHEFTSLEFQCFWAPVESWCNRITCNFSWSCYCCHSSLPLETFMPVWPGVLLCVLAPHPACIRYKVRPAWLVGGENGRKFAMHAQNTPKRAISSEQGEFYTAPAVRRGVLGEFCTGSGAV